MPQNNGSVNILLIVERTGSDSDRVIRLDTYVARHAPNMSRSRVQKLLAAGRILVNGQVGKANMPLKGGEKIEIDIPPPLVLDTAPENIELDIVFQDEALAVINKPAGMVTHPGAGKSSGTLVNALLHHMHGSLSGIGGAVRPGIVHRLDKDTSGLLVIAKDDRAHQYLSEQIGAKQAKRIYIALVAGWVRDLEGIIDKPIGRHPVKRKEMAVVAKGGRLAQTHYCVLKHFEKYTLLELELKTGRTHQIRVHMAHIGHPVVGDLVYNHGESGGAKARARLGLVGHALHAARLSFLHPITKQLLEFEAPLPDDFQKLVGKLGG